MRHGFTTDIRAHGSLDDWRFYTVKDAEKFKNYLTDRGAVVLPPTNPWEVVRFRTQNGVSVVYTNKNGHLTFTGESQKAYDFYKSGRKWVAVNRKRQSLKAQKQKIAERDGKVCWFHGDKLDYDQLTIEHLLEFSKGGSDHIANLVLACEESNTAVVGMSISEKVAYRDSLRINGHTATGIMTRVKEMLR